MTETRPGDTGLKAGLAGVDITPDRPLPLEGYGVRSGLATGTLDPLEARAIVFDDGTCQAAIVTADLCGLEAPSVQRVRAAVESTCGIPGDHVIVTFSHTHGAPAVTPFAGVSIDDTYLHWLEGRLADVVARAAAHLQPVTLGVGQGAMDFNVNRRRRTPEGTVMRANLAGPVDRRVCVLRVDAADIPIPPGTLGGKALPQADPLAVLFSYACHATVLGGDNTRYTADYPGAARRFVEHAYQSDGIAGAAADQRAGRHDTSALFLPTCFGNLRPHLLRPDGAFRSGSDHELRVLGRLLGSEVVQVAERVVAEPVERVAIGRRDVWLPYTRVPDPVELRDALDGARVEWAQLMLARLEREGRLPAGEMAEVQVLRLGRHWLVATPGETTLEIGLSIERGLIELGLAQPERGDLTLVIGYANGYVGYLCSASVQMEGGYEPGDYPSYQRPAAFAPEIEPALVNTALTLAQEMSVWR
jgi:neutral ceramidase